MRHQRGIYLRGDDPADPVVVTAISDRLGLSRRIVTTLEDENLIKDGTALTTFRVVVSAAVTGTFSLLDAGLQFALYGTGGAAIGLLVGWVISRVRWWAEDLLVEITISLFTPYAAYIPAEELGASGVLRAREARGPPRPLRAPIAFRAKVP